MMKQAADKNNEEVPVQETEAFVPRAAWGPPIYFMRPTH